jgi:predicted GNAT family acetyltransferase
MKHSIAHDSAQQRYELEEAGLTAYAEYEQREDGVRVFTHTIVPGPIEGQGLGSELARAALDDARQAGVKIIARCEFIAAFIERHPEYADLLAPNQT